MAKFKKKKQKEDEYYDDRYGRKEEEGGLKRGNNEGSLTCIPTSYTRKENPTKIFAAHPKHTQQIQVPRTINNKEMGKNNAQIWRDCSRDVTQKRLKRHRKAVQNRVPINE